MRRSIIGGATHRGGDGTEVSNVAWEAAGEKWRTLLFQHTCHFRTVHTSRPTHMVAASAQFAAGVGRRWPRSASRGWW